MKIHKTKLSILLIGLLVVLVAIIIQPAYALTGFNSSQYHNIGGSPDKNLTNYPIWIDIYNTAGLSTGSNCYLNGGSLNFPNDIRFTTGDGNTILPYWIQTNSTNATYSRFWINMSNISQGYAVTTPLMIWYGNASVGSLSNGSLTFPFFDDFNGSSLNSSLWTNINSATITVSGGLVNISSPVDGQSQGMLGNVFFNYNYSVTFRAQTALNGNYTNNWQQLDWRNNTMDQEADFIASQPGNAITPCLNNWNGVSSNSLGIYGWSNTSFHIVELKHMPSIIYGSIDSGAQVSNSGYVPTVLMSPYVMSRKQNSAPSYNTTVDWVYVRPITTNEPTHGSWNNVTVIGSTNGFFAYQLGGFAPAIIQFKDTSNISNILGWNWSFGDGTANATVQNPTHTYTQPGIYTVTLSIINNSSIYTYTNVNYISILNSFNESNIALNYNQSLAYTTNSRLSYASVFNGYIYESQWTNTYKLNEYYLNGSLVNSANIIDTNTYLEGFTPYVYNGIIYVPAFDSTTGRVYTYYQNNLTLINEFKFINNGGLIVAAMYDPQDNRMLFPGGNGNGNPAFFMYAVDPSLCANSSAYYRINIGNYTNNRTVGSVSSPSEVQIAIYNNKTYAMCTGYPSSTMLDEYLYSSSDLSTWTLEWHKLGIMPSTAGVFNHITANDKWLAVGIVTNDTTLNNTYRIDYMNTTSGWKEYDTNLGLIPNEENHPNVNVITGNSNSIIFERSARYVLSSVNYHYIYTFNCLNNSLKYQLTLPNYGFNDRLVMSDYNGNIYVPNNNQNTGVTTISEIAVLTLSSAGSPISNFNMNVSSGIAPLMVQFTDTSSSNITSWSWDFGDGNTSTAQNPVHTYPTGSLTPITVTLIVTNASGSSSSSQYLIVNYPAPVVQFHADLLNTVIGQKIQFTNDTVTHGIVSDIEWNFGDGTANGTDLNPVHSYSAGGVYTVTLTINDSGGSGTLQKVGYITISANATPTPTITPTPKPPTITPYPTITPAPSAPIDWNNTVRTNSALGGSPVWNATIVPNNIGPQVYNNATNDLFGGGDFTNINIDAFLGDTVIPFTLSYGPFFWAMLFGVIALIMFMKQENAVIPVLLTIIGGVPIVLSPYLPLDWQKFIGVLVVLVIASILYVLKRKR